MGPYKVALTAGIMSGNEIDVAKWIAQEIRDKKTSTDTVLAFPFLLIQIYLDVGLQKLAGFDRFLMPRTTTDLGLIRDVIHLISNMAKLEASMVSDVYEAQV